MQNLHFDDANVIFHSDYLNKDEGDLIFNNLSAIFEKEVPNYIVNDKGDNLYKLKRKTLVYVDKDIDKSVIPKIWGNNVKISEFTDELLNLKNKLEVDLNFKFNICLVNYYNTGKNTIGWHSDQEEKGSTSCIASISLGSPRKFAFRKNNTHDIYSEIILPSHSLIVMGDGTQENYQHSVLIDKNCKAPRLNLTFRLFDKERYSSY